MILYKEDRTMKKTLILAALAAIALCTCQKEPAPQEVPDAPGTGTGPVFTAITEGAATRTALSENGGAYDVVWRNGDRITIVDGAATPNVGVYSTTSTTSSAEFSFADEGMAASEPTYKAWYPASIYNAGTPTLPAIQDYIAGNISGFPMYAESGTTSLSFKNLCGIIRLNVSTTQDGKRVRRIILSATQGMSGPVSNAATLVADSYVATVSGTAGVTLDCGESGVAIGSVATPFHIAVPANTYTTLKITVLTTGGEVQTRTSNKGITVNRSEITDITLGFGSLAATSGTAAITGGGSQEWVQLWPGGPRWAKFNVGSTITSYAGVTEYSNPGVVGGYYSYKGRYDSTADAGGTSDTATYIWGSNWATPSGEQENELLSNCTWEYCDGSSVQYEPGCTLAGWKVSGKDAGFTENSIFIPFAGIRDQNNKARETVGTRACLWSTASGGSGAYFINMNSASHEYVSANTPHGLSVRAICVNDKDDVDLSASGVGAFFTDDYTSPFKTYLGKTDEEIQIILDNLWNHYFKGDNDSKVYYDKGTEAYILDTNDNEVKSEGMAYGMMICVQTNHKEEFDKLWKWAKNHMWYKGGDLDGYFAGIRGANGTGGDDMVHPEAQMYFMASLLFAAHRWKDAQLKEDAQYIMDKMWGNPNHKLFNEDYSIITYMPQGNEKNFTCPANDLPAFLELFTRWSPDNQDLWEKALSATRTHLYVSSNIQSGLFPEINNFDGTPHAIYYNSNATRYYTEAIRCAMNFGMDYYLFRADDDRQKAMAKRIIDFFEADGYQHARFNWDGSSPSESYTVGQMGCNAVACYALMSEEGYEDIIKKNLQKAWDAVFMTGQYRYYDGMVHFLAMLHLCGSFRIWKPQE